MSASLIASVVLVVILVSGIRIAPDGGRLVVVRLGRPCHVLGPGIRFILPLVDRVHRVDLESTLPEWRHLAEADIAQRLLHLAQTGILDARPH